VDITGAGIMVANTGITITEMAGIVVETATNEDR
jgi:hypothetical protein